MKYKMIVLDMDDTLLTSDNEILPSTKEALLKAQQLGVKVVLASGRPTGGMMDAALQLQLDKFDSFIISYNGAAIYDMANARFVEKTYVDSTQFKEIVAFLRNENIMALSYKDNKIYYEGTSEYEHVEGELTGLEMVKTTDLLKMIQTDVPKVMGVGNIDHISKLNNKLNGKFGEQIHATTSKPFFLEFMNKDVSKGKVLARFLQHLNINTEEIIAFGDSNNDKDMLEVVGLGVAMGNATDTIKSVADIITLDHNEDGIYKIIDEYIINKHK
ncbi:Cof-type HAD-IIB family hydrolase [Macrococcus armenti]|uniref:Cof-type HAD-IIB family hydrolase n=1 Tax=Macrococcus armenti TaxID=2875764 RepID=A0ABY3ZXE9_9STAP|nr:Cof-type HAD-IIB family hydrolase [Macrococcus armenti]UOB21538.1 Cof-type HAD-IIB family hydrolase [Macrococcus armenti]